MNGAGSLVLQFSSAILPNRQTSLARAVVTCRILGKVRNPRTPEAGRMIGSLRASIGAILVWLACGGILGAQDAPPSREIARGSQVFRHVLHEMNLQPLQTCEQLAEDPAHNLLIVLGETAVLHSLLPVRLEDFVRSGGSALIATDRAASRGLEGFDIRFVDGYPAQLRIEPDSPFAYRGSRECILVEGTKAGRPLFENLKRVATNRPGYLDARFSRLEVLGSFPKEVTVNGQRLPRRTFAAGGSWGEGRVLFLSDHSVFINAMLLPDDNDNYDFAQNCVRWLARDKVTHVLFVDEDVTETSFEVPVRDQPLPPVESIVQAVDQGLQGLEEENRFNLLLWDALERLPVDTLLKLAFIGSALGLAVYGLALMAHSRHRVEAETPLLATSLEQLTSRLDLAEQRQRWQLRGGNYWEAARSLARQELEALYGSEITADSPPRLERKGGWYGTFVLRRRLRRLWRLAYSDRPRTISGPQLLRMGADIDELRRYPPERGP
jgi:hypothetical protein